MIVATFNQSRLVAVTKRISLRTNSTYVYSSNYSYRYQFRKSAIFVLKRIYIFMPNIWKNAEYSAIQPNILHNLTCILSEYNSKITENSVKWPNIRHIPNICPQNKHSYGYEDSEAFEKRKYVFVRRRFSAFRLVTANIPCHFIRSALHEHYMSMVARWLQSNFQIVCVWQCKIGSLPFLELRRHALHPGRLQGKKGIEFCHLATLIETHLEQGG